MKALRILFAVLLFAPFCSFAQQITFSEPFREDSKDMDFDIIGKVNKNILILKNIRQQYALNIYNDSMIIQDKVEFELPGKTFNADYIAYPDFFYLVYQYQKKGVLYCMAVKVDGNGKRLQDPIQLDTTSVGIMGDNKIYSTIYSEDKKRIMIFKIQRNDDVLNFATLLFDNQLQLLHKTRYQLQYNERNDVMGEFMLDNDGNFIFAHSSKKGSRENLSQISLMVKKALEDTFTSHRLELGGRYADEVKIKIDNRNKKYITTSFYYKERNGNIMGLWCNIWDAVGNTVFANVYTEFNEEIRSAARSSGNTKFAFNDFFIRNIILKKDGSLFITAEDFSSQSSGGNNNWNRFDYLYGSPFLSPYDYYYYSPYGYYYRPFSSFNRSIRYYYDNILVINLSSKAIPEWSNIIHKQQVSDENDNYLSYCIFNTGGEIQFLYNDISKREKLLSANIINRDGATRRNPTLKTNERGYEFMPRYAKQIGARQVIIPCTYRAQICFAKVDF